METKDVRLTEAQRAQLESFLANGALFTSVASDLTTLEELLALGLAKRVTYSGQTATWNLIWDITAAGRAALRNDS